MGRQTFIGFWAVASLFTTGCRIFSGTDEPSEMRAAPQSLPAAIGSLAEWDQLDADVRVEILSSQYERYAQLSVSPRQAVDAFANSAHRTFAERMAAYLRTNGDMEVGDALHARVGPLLVTARVATLASDVIGGEIWFWHQGCDMPDETTPAFTTPSEADVAGCELGDEFYWAAHGTFNRDGNPFEYSDFMEWGAPQ